MLGVCGFFVPHFRLCIYSHIERNDDTQSLTTNNALDAESGSLRNLLNVRLLFTGQLNVLFKRCTSRCMCNPRLASTKQDSPSYASRAKMEKYIRTPWEWPALIG